MRPRDPSPDERAPIRAIDQFNRSSARASRPFGLRVVYVTAQLPFGANEAFIVPEVIALGQHGCKVNLVPVRPRGGLVHDDAGPLLDDAVLLPLLSPRILAGAALELARSPVRSMRAIASLAGARSLRILAKNLVVYPKGLWLARYARQTEVDHIHAHWGGTSATVALVASEISQIPWSLTVHRWDIDEDNLLELKARKARFIRAISELGARDLRRRLKNGSKPWLLHMGVVPPDCSATFRSEPPLRVLMAAEFLDVKGHVYLIDAMGMLKQRGVSVRLELAGDGPLRASIVDRVRHLRLQGEVDFLGIVPHGRLLERLASGEWHVVVQPSVVTQAGEQEGIPVALIEAASCGVPLVATETGGIPELLRDGVGFLVPPRDARAIADTLALLAGDPELRRQLGARGRRRIEEEFLAQRVARKMMDRFCEASGKEAQCRG
jgi:colanic acid/amylovoran biosynthesis glycosyltransferase